MKKLYIVIAVIAAATLSVWWWSTKQADTEVPLNTEDLNNDVQEIDANDLDKEFKQIDQDLNSL